MMTLERASLRGWAFIIFAIAIMSDTCVSFVWAQTTHFVERAPDGRYNVDAGYGVTLSLPEELAQQVRLQYSPHTSHCHRIRKDLGIPTVKNAADDNDIGKCYEDGLRQDVNRYFSILSPEPSWLERNTGVADLIIRDIEIFVSPRSGETWKKYSRFSDKRVFQSTTALGYDVYADPKDLALAEENPELKKGTRWPPWLGYLLPGPRRTPPAARPRLIACPMLVDRECALSILGRSGRLRLTARWLSRYVPHERWDEVERALRSFASKFVLDVENEELQ